jgi:regulator of protease activity HflC (stomatin/prohibitin superfamily)
MYYFVAFLFILALIGLGVFKNMFNQKMEKARIRGRQRGDMSEADLGAMLSAEKFPVPKFVNMVLVAGMLVSGGWGLFNDMFFYAESGFVYHVRTITGEEKMVNEVGYNMHLFGRVNPWKKALSVVAEQNMGQVEASAVLPQIRVTFLDQVDALISASARFRLPSDQENFLRMAREYRSEENLLRTTLIPAFQETVRGNAALMGADDYFSGSQTQFNIDFENQLNDGLFIIKRNEVKTNRSGSSRSTANATKGTNQEDFDDDEKVVFEVDKVLDSQGVALRKGQSFSRFGITIAEARITDVLPNEKFVERMGLKQKASADRAIAREQRIQEEEQKGLAEAKGERQVAEKKAEALVDQIERTTKAETEKQLALTDASREMEKAEIQRVQAEILFQKAEIDAKSVKVAADAEAYKKREVLLADNALAQKLQTLENINKAWAEAFAVRNVPTTVFGGGQEGVSSDSNAQNFMDILTMKAAKDLSVDLEIGNNK